MFTVLNITIIIIYFFPTLTEAINKVPYVQGVSNELLDGGEGRGKGGIGDRGKVTVYRTCIYVVGVDN